MIELYAWPTPNGHKVSIMLEECGLPYEVIAVDINKGEQFAPAFLAISPNNRMPAIIDRDGPGGEALSVFESGAILVYLAEKTGKFMPKDMAKRYQVIQWVMFQMGGIGPIFGQVHHFLRAAKEDVPYGIKRYSTEARRLYGVLDAHLDGQDFLANNELSIADFCTVPWVFRHDWQKIDLNEYPNVKRWYDSLMARPALARGMEIP